MQAQSLTRAPCASACGSLKPLCLLEATPGLFKAKPRLFEAKPGLLEAKPRLFEAKPGLLEVANELPALLGLTEPADVARGPAKQKYMYIGR